MNKCNKLLVIGCLLIIGMYSCRRDTGSVGANILPASDLISAYQTDTATLITSMYLRSPDSVITSNSNNGMLGQYTDPIFGQVKASIYAMVYSPEGSTTIPWNGQYTSSNYSNYILNTDTGAVDSAVLLLPVSSYYGNLGTQTFMVYETSNGIDTGKAYNSDTSIAYVHTAIGVQEEAPNYPTNDTIRIKLNASWVSNFIANMNNKPSYYYPNTDSLIPGIYVIVNDNGQFPGQGGIYYLNLTSGFAGIYVYFHSIEPITPKPEYNIRFVVGVNNDSYFTHVDRNYATAPFMSQHPAGKKDSIAADNLVYIQDAGGPTGRINFPNLYKNWSKLNPVIINKAEVDMKVNAADCPPPFAPPTNLYLLATNKYGEINFAGLPDQGAPMGWYGGVYDGYNNIYKFNITEYMQNVVQGKDTDRGLYIIPGNQATTTNRVVLYGAQNNASYRSNNRMRLLIYYTPVYPAKTK
jgi:Domain of unknown function (DUF4270)